MTRPHRGLGWWLRLVALLAVAGRVARAATRTAPVRAMVRPSRDHRGRPTHGSISVVIPARDEADRIGPALTAILGAPGVDEVIVVDDGSVDGTADLAAAVGARVVNGAPLPPGWAGKSWALQQGIEAASGDWIVTLDADTRPDPELPGALVARAVSDQWDLLTVGGRFDAPSVGARWLHPAMLTTLVYRFGPVGTNRPPRADRLLANGQCMTFRRAAMRAAGGFEPVADQPVEDVALARHWARAGARVGFLDASELLEVRMYETATDTWRGWGRSLALGGVEPRSRQLVDLAMLIAVQGALPVRLAVGALRRRPPDAVDLAALAVRLGTLVGTAAVYRHRGLAYWCSPVADPIAVAAVGLGVVRRRHRWRGREYLTPAPSRSRRDGPAAPPARTATR